MLKFKVMTVSTSDQRKNNTLEAYIVTDRGENYKDTEHWPEAARFTVSLRHDQQIQEKRAHEYCAYLNKCVIFAPGIGTV